MRRLGGVVAGVRHRNFVWDDPEGNLGETQEFLDCGYQLTRDVFMFTKGLSRPGHFNEGLVVRQLCGDRDWEEALAIHAEGEFESVPEFVKAQVRRNRWFAEAGFARWFGGFVGEELVTTMGMVNCSGLGRCQAVATAAGHRGKGYASTLVYEVCSEALAEMGGGGDYDHGRCDEFIVSVVSIVGV